MKFILLLFIFPTTSIAQVIIYYNSDFEITMPEFANHHRIASIDENNGTFIGKVDDFRIDSTRYLSITYDSLGIKNGPFIYYSDDGTPLLLGNFNSNQLYGKIQLITINNSGRDTIAIDVLPDSIKHNIDTKESFTQSQYIRINDYPTLKSMLSPRSTRNDTMFLEYNGLYVAFTFVEQMPEFPGGMTNFARMLGYFLIYPQYALDNNITGKVYIQFVVLPDGTVEEVITLKGIGGGCDEAAERAIKLMPDWKPGYQKGKPVPVRMMIPITFQ